MAVAINSGQLIRLKTAEVKSRRRKYLADAEKHLSNYKDWQNLERRERLALGRYAFKSAGKQGGSRRLPHFAELGVLAVEKGSSEILRATSCLTAAFSPRCIIDELMHGRAPQHHEQVFNGEDRLYFELLLDTTKSTTQKEVADHLAGSGYAILDYKSGYCTDSKGKQTFKIGRLLKNAPDLAKAFEQDKTRVGELMVVVSRHPYDIARMSTDRGWSSCMAKSGINYHYVAKDIEAGTLVSYLVRKNDTNIEDPLSRQLLKPYFDVDRGEAIMVPQQVYGLKNASFGETNAKVCAELFNKGKSGSFNRPEALYADGIGSVCELHSDGSYDIAKGGRHLPPNLRDGTATTRDLFAYLNIPFATEIAKDGSELYVLPEHEWQELDLSNHGIVQLPKDFSQVRTSRINLEHNELTSLERVPTGLSILNVSGNNLSDLKSVPADTFFLLADDNQITTLEGTTPGIIRLRVFNNPLKSLKGAPRGLEILAADNCRMLMEIGCEGSEKLHLSLADTGFTRLDLVPSPLRGVSLSGNGLQSLKGLPSGIRSVNAEHNDLRSLDGAPNDLLALDVSYNAMQTLDGLPSNLLALRARHNALADLGNLPETLQQIDVSHNQITSVVSLPASVRRLDLGYNPLQCVSGIPQECEAYYKLGIANPNAYRV